MSISDVEAVDSSALEEANPHPTLDDLQAAPRGVKKIARNQDWRNEPGSLKLPSVPDSIWTQAQPTLMVTCKFIEGVLFATPGRYRLKFSDGHVLKSPLNSAQVEGFVVNEEVGMAAVVVEPLPDHVFWPAETRYFLHLDKCLEFPVAIGDGKIL
ncbi:MULTISPECIES: hypothetical protein [unclassified Micromonospora]|uniref:hypothetical protein n=1 Tax=unclassified Micromonospora TaxID=2617518 RepID=UPI0011839610|nr:MULTISPECIES: hypothetical protein [unclassified Micromonospora]MDI5938058.1 hypothetical protein [Micromonospora sp. DH15]